MNKVELVILVAQGNKLHTFEGKHEQVVAIETDWFDSPLVGVKVKIAGTPGKCPNIFF
jgi:hypothetical protein